MSTKHTTRLSPEICSGKEGPGGFETSDFYLACFLRCVGFDVTDVRWEGRRAIFVFQNQADARAVMMSFYNNQTTIRPLDFVGAIRDMKALLHNTQV